MTKPTAATPGDRDRGRELVDVVAQDEAADRLFAASEHGGALPRRFRADVRAVLAALRDETERAEAALAAPAETETEAGDRWNAFTSAVYRATDRLGEHRDPAIRGAAAEVVAAIGRYVAAAPPAQGPAETEAGGAPELWWSPPGPGERRGAILHLTPAGNFEPLQGSRERWTALPANAVRLAAAATAPAAGPVVHRSRDTGSVYPVVCCGRRDVPWTWVDAEVTCSKYTAPTASGAGDEAASGGDRS